MRSVHELLAGQAIIPRYHPILSLRTGSVVGVGVRAACAGARAGGRDRDGLRIERLAQQAGAVDEYLAQFTAAASADLRAPRRSGSAWWVALRVGGDALAEPTLLEHVGRDHLAGIATAGRVLLEVDAASLGAIDGTPAGDALIEAGIRFSVTDFGAAGMTPSTLLNLPVEQIHVDVGKLSIADARDIEILESLVAVADSLAIDVIADGVEGASQLRLADSVGIAYGQGYLWGSPGAMAKLVQTWNRSA